MTTATDDRGSAHVVLVAVARVHPTDQLLTDLTREIEIDVGHRRQGLVQESPDEQVAPDGIDVRQAEQVTDDGRDGGSASPAGEQVAARAPAPRAHVGGDLAGEVEQVDVPGAEGDFGVLPGHSLVVSGVRPGVIDVHDTGAITDRLFIAGGFAEATPERCTILADEALPVSDLKRDEIEARIRDGRSFTTRRVVAIQHGQAIFNLATSFHVTEDGFEHFDRMPVVSVPDDLPEADRWAEGQPETIDRQGAPHVGHARRAAGPAYLPVNFGWRLALNAVSPSLMSSDCP